MSSYPEKGSNSQMNHSSELHVTFHTKYEYEKQNKKTH